MPSLILGAYLAVLALLSLYGLHRYWILFLYWRHYKRAPRLAPPPTPADWPRVTVQLPVYNEYYVVERLLDAVTALDYPRERLDIQLLDDSTDESRTLAAALVEKKRAAGHNVRLVQRDNRRGFKAGALDNGLALSDAEYVVIFDADLLPPTNFLMKSIP